MTRTLPPTGGSNSGHYHKGDTMYRNENIEILDKALELARGGEQVDVAIRKASNEYGVDLCGMMFEDMYHDIQSVIMSDDVDIEHVIECYDHFGHFPD